MTCTIVNTQEDGNNFNPMEKPLFLSQKRLLRLLEEGKNRFNPLVGEKMRPLPQDQMMNQGIT